MIRHVVLVRFRHDVSPQEVEAIFEQLRDLRHVLPGLSAFAGGPNVSPEALDRGFGHAFSCDFVDAAARDAYLIHPALQAAGARLVAAAKVGLTG